MIYDVVDATEVHVPGMSDLLRVILTAQGSPRRWNADEIRARYVAKSYRVACSVAVAQGGHVLGFQSLKRAWEGNPYDVTPGWGVIGTYVHPEAQGLGVGHALFGASRRAAIAAGLPVIDASIGSDNTQGRAYYAAMGFQSYRNEPGNGLQATQVVTPVLTDRSPGPRIETA